MPKFDDLCAVIAALNPDIVCIVESWLCSDISVSEISVPGYQIIRLDRNRHGGGGGINTYRLRTRMNASQKVVNIEKSP